jgi:hypothetical protein
MATWRLPRSPRASVSRFSSAFFASSRKEALLLLFEQLALLLQALLHVAQFGLRLHAGGLLLVEPLLQVGCPAGLSARQGPQAGGREIGQAEADGQPGDEQQHVGHVSPPDAAPVPILRRPNHLSSVGRAAGDASSGKRPGADEKSAATAEAGVGCKRMGSFRESLF